MIAISRFNINCEVEVQLTDYGKKIYDELEYRKDYPNYNENNTLRIQIWKFMNIFGKYFDTTNKQITVSNEMILIGLEE